MGDDAGTGAGDAAAAVPPRASTLVAVATMAAIALVSVTAIVVWARVGPGTGGAQAAEPLEEIPSSLAGEIEPTSVPADVVGAFDGPVVGARRLDELPPDVLDACNQFNELQWADGEPSLTSAVATPDGIIGVLEGKAEVPNGFGEWEGPGGEDPERFRQSCNARFEDGRWVSDGGGFEPVFPDQPDPPMFGGSFCCDSRGLGTATGQVTVVDGTTWIVQDRVSWYVGYPVTDQDESITVTWKYREGRFGPGGPPQSRIFFVDDSGEILGEGFAGGAF